MTDETGSIDTIDRQIIGQLMADARAPVVAIAEAIALSRSATSERIKRLEQAGWITGYQAELHPAVTGRTLEAVVGLQLDADADRSAVEDWIAHQPAVTEALHLTGPHDYLLRLRCTDTNELDELLMSMKNDTKIATTETRVVLRHLQVTPDLTGAAELLSRSQSDRQPSPARCDRCLRRVP
jgi:Lrp/AsnC family leucine-responsive transcriptional regulator